MNNDPELELQADNGRNVGPIGFAILAFCVVPCVVASWNWAKILAWFSIVTLIICGIGFGILATR